VIGRGDDDVLRRERERDDVDGSLAGLKCGRPDALELLTVERPPIGRVGPLRRAKAEPVDQHDASALGKAQRQGRQLDARTGRIEAVQEQDRPPLAQPVARDPTGIGVQIEWVAMNGRG